MSSSSSDDIYFLTDISVINPYLRRKRAFNTAITMVHTNKKVMVGLEEVLCCFCNKVMSRIR